MGKKATKYNVGQLLLADDNVNVSGFQATVISVGEPRTVNLKDGSQKTVLKLRLGDASTEKTIGLDIWEPRDTFTAGDTVRITRGYIKTDSFTTKEGTAVNEKCLKLSMESKQYGTPAGEVLKVTGENVLVEGLLNKLIALMVAAELDSDKVFGGDGKPAVVFTDEETAEIERRLAGGEPIFQSTSEVA